MNSFDDALPVYPSIRQSLLIVGIVILFACACTPIMTLHTWIGSEAATFVYYGSAFGLSFCVVHSIRKRKQGSSSYDFRIGSWRRMIPLSFGTVALLFGVVSPIGSLIPIPESLKEVVRTAVSEVGLFTFLYFVLAAPILEELIFRGIMLDGLLKRYTPLTSILVSSFLFGFVHLNPWQFVTGLVLGCFLGWAYYRSGSVAACIVMHMSANFSGYLMRLFIFANPLVDKPGGIFDSSGGANVRSVAVNATCVVVFVISVYWLRRDYDKHLVLVGSAVRAALASASVRTEGEKQSED